MLSEVSMVVVWVSAFGERNLPIGGWLILRHPNRDSCPEPLFFDLTNQVFLLRSKAPSHLFLPVCVSACLFVYLLPIHLSMRQPLSVCNNAGWHLLEAVCQCVTCVSSTDFFAPALPAQLFFLSQHCCFVAPVFLVHSLAVWVTLALQNMPPKARAPEARMVFGWDQVSGVEFCTCSGPSRCLPTVIDTISKRWRSKRAFNTSPSHIFPQADSYSIPFYIDIIN